MTSTDKLTAYETPHSAELDAIAKQIGYGRSCQILGELWDQMLEREYGRPSTRGKMERRRDIEEIEAAIAARATQPSSAPAEPTCRNCMGFGWEPSVNAGRLACSACKPVAAPQGQAESGVAEPGLMGVVKPAETRMDTGFGGGLLGVAQGQAEPVAGDFVLVPRVPTDDMIVAFCETWYSKVRCFDDPEMDDAYASMIEAAPAKPTPATTQEIRAVDHVNEVVEMVAAQPTQAAIRDFRTTEMRADSNSPEFEGIRNSLPTQAVERDAARYRFIRSTENNGYILSGSSGMGKWNVTQKLRDGESRFYFGEQLDIAVDAAIASMTKEAKND